MKKRGMTLIELIAVIAILAIIASIVIVKVSGYIERAEQVNIKNDAAEVINLAYEQREAFGPNCITYINKARVITILHPTMDQKIIPLPLENVDEVGNALGWGTTYQELQEIVKMPVNKIPVEHGRVKQIYGQADLS